MTRVADTELRASIVDAAPACDSGRSAETNIDADINLTGIGTLGSGVDEERKLLRDMRRTALDALARREHSTLELRRKLDQKFGYSHFTSQVLDKLNQDKLLSDERFAESYVRYRSRVGFGPQRISKELSERGVSGLHISSALREYDNEWLGIARREYSKKFPAGLTATHAERMKQMRFLQYRGFSFDIIDQVVSDQVV